MNGERCCGEGMVHWFTDRFSHAVTNSSLLIRWGYVLGQPHFRDRMGLWCPALPQGGLVPSDLSQGGLASSPLPQGGLVPSPLSQGGLVPPLPFPRAV